MPSLGMMTINSLVAADSIIIPAQPSFLSTKGLGLLLKSVTKVRRSINPKLTIDGMKEALCLSVSKSDNGKNAAAAKNNRGSRTNHDRW